MANIPNVRGSGWVKIMSEGELKKRIVVLAGYDGKMFGADLRLFDKKLGEILDEVAKEFQQAEEAGVASLPNYETRQTKLNMYRVIVKKWFR